MSYINPQDQSKITCTNCHEVTTNDGRKVWVCEQCGEENTPVVADAMDAQAQILSAAADAGVSMPVAAAPTSIPVVQAVPSATAPPAILESPVVPVIPPMAIDPIASMAPAAPVVPPEPVAPPVVPIAPPVAPVAPPAPAAVQTAS